MPSFKTFRDSLHLLTTRRFGTFWFASLLSSIGTWAQQVAEPWLLLTLGASSFLIGVDSFAMNAPVWLLTLVGGTLADRHDRRRVITVFQSIQMLCPSIIVVLLLLGLVKPWMIIVLSVVVGVTDALSMPSFQSIVPSIVTRDQIRLGLALNSTQFNLSRIVGPSIAGVLMASVGAMACFVVSAVSYIPFIGVALWILPRWTPETQTVAAPLSATPKEGLFTGVRAIVKQRHLLGGLMTALSTSILCVPLMTFAPVLVKEVFHGEASRFSAALASFGVGGLIGAGGLLALGPSVDLRKVSTGFALLHGVVVIACSVMPWFIGLPPLLVLAGISMTVSNTSANSLLQSTAEKKLLGRTVSLYLLAARGGMSIGALITGATVSLLGVQHALLVNGVLAVVIQLVVGRMWLKAPLPAQADDSSAVAHASS